MRNTLSKCQPLSGEETNQRRNSQPRRGHPTSVLGKCSPRSPHSECRSRVSLSGHLISVPVLPLTRQVFSTKMTSLKN
ncbi:hypothetical protein J6590_085028 [Homalodisca vitripennis]|nr:hypothetical protein J6590_085028 [Homalodisca vitripennis]